MPQDTFWEDDERWTGVRLEMEEVITPEGRRWDVKVQRSDERGQWRTVYVASWRGVMLDFVGTLGSDCMSAFFFGERRDLARAASSVTALARQHRRTHERVGF